MNRRKCKQRRQNTTTTETKTSEVPVVRTERSVWSRRDTTWLVVVVLAAVGLRLVYVSQLRGSPLYEQPTMDALYHDQWAQAIAAGERLMEGPYFRAPLYPALLGGVYAVFGGGYTAPRIVQSLLGAVGCGVVFLIGRRLFGRTAAGVAGLAAASYWVLIYFDGELLIPTLIVLLDLLLIGQLLRAYHKPSALAYGLAGVLLGLSAIARPNVLLFGPAVVVWVLIAYRGQLRQALRYVVCFGAAALVPILPITIRNYVVGEDLVLIASQGGVNFYIGNNPDSDGVTAVVPGTPGDWWGGYYAAIARAEAAEGRSLKPSEVSSYYFRQAGKFIAEQPGRFASLTLKRLRYFWTRRELPNNQSLYFWTERFTPVVGWLPLGFWIVGPLSLVGLWSCRRRGVELFPLWGFVLVYMVSVVLFFCNARYRAPVLPPLILLAVFGAFSLARLVRQRQWQAALVPGVVLVLGAAWVNVAPQGEGTAMAIMSRNMLARAYQRQGKGDEAEAAYAETLELAPDLVTARYNLATLLLRDGRIGEAVPHLQVAARSTVRPRFGEKPVDGALAEYDLARALGRLGRAAEAGPHLARAVERFGSIVASGSEDADAVCGLGLALADLGREQDCVAPLERCLALRADHHAVRARLGFLLTRQGRYGRAIEVLRGGLAAADPRVVSFLAWVLATGPDPALRDGVEAVRLARGLCADPTTCEPVHLDILAAGLAEAGRFDDAIATVRQALDRLRLDSSPRGEALGRDMSLRLRLYEQRQPYHESPVSATP